MAVRGLPLLAASALLPATPAGAQEVERGIAVDVKTQGPPIRFYRISQAEFRNLARGGRVDVTRLRAQADSHRASREGTRVYLRHRVSYFLIPECNGRLNWAQHEPATGRISHQVKTVTLQC